MKNVEDLDVFKKVHQLVLKLYKITNSFPSDEKYSLTSQIRRAAGSINANLMEGNYRLNIKEFRQFTGIARGSAGELKYHILLAKDLEYINVDTYNTILQELIDITKMLYGLANSLSKKQ